MVCLGFDPGTKGRRRRIDVVVRGNSATEQMKKLSPGIFHRCIQNSFKLNESKMPPMTKRLNMSKQTSVKKQQSNAENVITRYNQRKRF